VTPFRPSKVQQIAAVALITLAASAAFVAGRLIKSEGNPSRFAYAGGKGVEGVDAARAPRSLYIFKDAGGFDGIIFYRISLDPFTRNRVVKGIPLDFPSFRFQRIVYPLLVHVTTSGDPERVAWALIAWNLAGMAALGCLGALLALSAGRQPYWGLTLVLAPAFAISLGLDTAEILAGVFLFAGLLTLRDQRFGWAAIFLSIAALTRETTLVLSIAGAISVLWTRRNRRAVKNTPPIWAFLVPLIVDAAWQIFLWIRWGHLPISQGSSLDVGFPFRGFIRSFRRWIPPTTASDLFNLVLVVVIVAFVFTVFRSLRESSALGHEKLAWVLTALALPFFQYSIWFHHWGFMRAFNEFTVLGSLIVLGNNKAPAHRLWIWVALWASIALQLALYA